VAAQRQKKQHQAKGEQDQLVSALPTACGNSTCSSSSSATRTYRAPPVPYSFQLGAHAGDEEEDAEFGSVISASIVSAPSSESTAVYSYLEELKKVADYNEEAKSIQRIIARRELRRQAKTLCATADEFSAKLLRAKAARTHQVSPGGSTCATATDRSTPADSPPTLTESSVHLADAADTHAGSDEQLWRRRLELSLTGTGGTKREEPFPIAPTDASLQQQAWRHSAAASDDGPASRLTPPRSEGGMDTSEDATDEELWQQRLRLYLDSAPPSTRCISSRAPSRFLVEDEEEDWEDFKSSLESLVDSVRANSRGSKDTDTLSKFKAADGREQEPRTRLRFCSFITFGLALAIPAVISVLPAGIVRSAMW